MQTHKKYTHELCLFLLYADLIELFGLLERLGQPICTDFRDLFQWLPNRTNFHVKDRKKHGTHFRKVTYAHMKNTTESVRLEVLQMSEVSASFEELFVFFSLLIRYIDINCSKETFKIYSISS